MAAAPACLTSLADRSCGHGLDPANPQPAYSRVGARYLGTPDRMDSLFWTQCRQLMYGTVSVIETCPTEQCCQYKKDGSSTIFYLSLLLSLSEFNILVVGGRVGGGAFVAGLQG